MSQLTKLCIKVKCTLKDKVSMFLEDERGVSFIGMLIALAIVVLVGAYVALPGFRTFMSDLMTDLGTWYTTNIKDKIFPTA
ncbi:hypothetical protein HZI73_26230 (plasmid) [Vallitalea pronyensis]|uniref:Uncharacterized protein n=1 Tax=Vallitalea pronyensis TaxID=1348613 RepID=A0A8J8MR26_9FIRM|nr:hypothetical protein [Vallitalea pronyensis]QUI25913.1 hypothetical protein HZI73_26230 [Vallitalea pronyensis]